MHASPNCGIPIALTFLYALNEQQGKENLGQELFSAGTKVNFGAITMVRCPSAEQQSELHGQAPGRSPIWILTLHD